MDTFFKSLYYCILGFTFLLVVYLTAALAFSPKNDALKRGFIPCTEAFVLHVSNCERGEIGCITKGLWQDTQCNLSVIADGFVNWLYNQQPTPWANYLFVPASQAELDQENPYIGVVSDDLNELENRRWFIENQQRELEEAKHRTLNLDKSVLTPTSDEDNAEKSGQYIEETTSMEIQSENIDDETSIDNILPSTDSKQTNKGDINDK